MVVTEDEIAFLKRLRSHGVEFWLIGHIGYLGALSFVSIQRLLEVGYDQFVAECLGISVSRYRAWVEHIKDPHCHALNRKGEPCRAYVKPHNNPVNFDPEVALFCIWHYHPGPAPVYSPTQKGDE